MTDFVSEARNGAGSDLPKLRRNGMQTHNVIQPLSTFSGRRQQGSEYVRTSNVVAAARSELLTSSTNSYKAAAFDDWFKAAFKDDDSNKRALSRRRGEGRKNGRGRGPDLQQNFKKRTPRLRKLNAKEFLERRKQEAKAHQNSLSRLQRRSKSIPSLKDSNKLPHFAQQTSTAVAKASTRKIKPDYKDKKKNKKNKKKHNKQYNSAKGCHNNDGETDIVSSSAEHASPSTSIDDSATSQRMKMKKKRNKKNHICRIPTRTCVGYFCKDLKSGRRNDDEALLLTLLTKRAVIEYKMFRECRSVMTSFEKSTMNEDVMVCQKCCLQYSKFCKAKGWKIKVILYVVC